MLPVARNCAIFPSILPVGKDTVLTAIPMGKTFLFFDGKEYNVTIINVFGDEKDYYQPETHIHLTVTAENGILKFPLNAPNEGEYMIIVEYNEKKLFEQNVYALEEDLYNLRPLKGELHTHTYRSDGTVDPAALASHYREAGYDFFALTDHNRFYPGEEIDESYADVTTGLTRVKGEEVHAPYCPVHIVHVGGRSSVAEIYWKDKERYDREVEECFNRVPAEVPEEYRDRYARALWVTDSIHAAGGVAIFPHPFWRSGRSKMHNVCDELAAIFLKSGMFDSFELLGGGGIAAYNKTSAFWGDLRAQGCDIPVVSSSDSHKIGPGEIGFGNLFTLCFAKDSDGDSITQAVKDGLTVAVQGEGSGYDRIYHCHGSYRLVCYALFLLNNYFPERQAIAESAGYAMRQHALGLNRKAVIDGLAEMSEDHYLRFFGRIAPLVPSEEVIAFEEKWRAVQMDGPTSKGSKIYGTGITRQL